MKKVTCKLYYNNTNILNNNNKKKNKMYFYEISIYTIKIELFNGFDVLILLS